MRKLATIRTISELRPIANADSLELAIVDGWECVVAKKDNFMVGDKVIYIEIDSVCPERPEFEFLRNRKFRVKTIKLRGQVSQGLVLPLSILKNQKINVGDDVTNVLGIKKYDPQAEVENKVVRPINSKNKLLKFMFRFAWFRTLYNKIVQAPRSDFPKGVKKTDEERVQNLSDRYSVWQMAKLKFFVTEKVDGQSGTYVLNKKNKYFVASRNYTLKKDMTTTYWQCSEKYNLETLLKDMKRYLKCDHIVLQGEILAPKVQGNKYGKTEPELYVFNIIADDYKLDYYEQVEVLAKCKATCQCVPLLYADFELPNTIGELVELSKGKSKVADVQREGFVIRNYGTDVSFKVINPNFLLKYDE